MRVENATERAGGDVPRRAPLRVRRNTVDDPRARILEAATETFKRYGIRRTRMEDIAELAGILRPNLYRHFPSKESLVLEVILRETRRTHAHRLKVLPIEGDPSKLLVDAMVLGYETATNDEFISLLMKPDAVGVTAEILGRAEEVQQVQAEYWHLVLDHCRRSGALRDDLSYDDIVRWFTIVQFTFLERHEFFDSAAAVRFYVERFVVPSLLSPRARKG